MRNKNKKGYQIIHPNANEERFSNYYCYYLFWVAVGYYLWKKILSITGYRFHPTDFELLHYYLHNKNLGRHTLVQAIAEVEDICGLEPWELPGHSNIHSGDEVWYFFYRPNYKYRNSTRIKRTTNEGYWKPTGNPRKIMARDHKTEIGSKRTLVFYKGRVSDKDRNKTGWIMHEYELTGQTTFMLSKLKRKCGKGELSCIEEGQSSQYLPSNLGNYIANNGIQAEAARHLTDQSDTNEILARLNDISNHEGLKYQSTEPWNSYLVGDFPENEGSSDLPFNFGNHVAEHAIPNHHQLLTEVPMQQDVPQNQSGTNEQDSKFGNLVPSDERSNQHNSVAEPWNSYLVGDFPENEGSSDLPFNFGNHVAEHAIPNHHQLLTEVPMQQDVPQDQSGTNEQDSKFGNLVPSDERSNQHNSVAENDESTPPSTSNNAAAGDFVQMDSSNLTGELRDEWFAELPELNCLVQGNGIKQLLDDWILDEEFREQEIPNASENQSSTNEQQNLTATNGGCRLSMMESTTHAISPPRKRPRSSTL